MFLSFSSMPCLPIDLNLLYSAVVSIGILCALFPTIATCLWHAGEPVPFSCVPFLFLVLFSYNVPFLSSSSMPCFPIDLNLRYSAAVSMGILWVLFPTIATCLCPAEGSGVPFSLILFSFLVRSFYDVLFISFLFYVFAHRSISAVVSMGILCVLFPIIATCLWHAEGSGLFSSLILFSFPVLSFYDVPFLFFPFLFLSFPFPFVSFSFPSLSFSSMFFCPLIYLCCSFHGPFYVRFSHHSHVFVPCRGTCVSFSSICFSFSRPFVLQVSCPVFFSNWRIVPAEFWRGKTFFLFWTDL